MLTSGLVNRQTQVIWIRSFDGSSERLFPMSASVKRRDVVPALDRSPIYTYVSSDQHLLREKLHILLVCRLRSGNTEWKDVLQIRNKEPSIAEIGGHDVRICADLVFDVDVVVSVLIEETSAEVCRTCNICDFVQRRRTGEVDKILDS